MFRQRICFYSCEGTIDKSGPHNVHSQYAYVLCAEVECSLKLIVISDSVLQFLTAT